MTDQRQQQIAATALSARAKSPKKKREPIATLRGSPSLTRAPRHAAHVQLLLPSLRLLYPGKMLGYRGDNSVGLLRYTGSVLEKGMWRDRYFKGCMSAV